MHLTELDIRNLRCIRKTSIQFDPPDGRLLSNINLIVGDNASGKSTVLKAIALAVLGGSISSAGFYPYFLVRRESSAERPSRPGLSIKATLMVDNEKQLAQTELKIIGTNDILVLEHSGIRLRGPSSRLTVPDVFHEADKPDYFLCGYGSNRQSQRNQSFDAYARDRVRSRRFQRVASLLEDEALLRPISSWLLSMASAKNGPAPVYEESLSILESLLHGTGVIYARDTYDGEALFHTRDDGSEERGGVSLTSVPVPALSDGHRSFLGWVGDLMHHLTSVTPPGTSLSSQKGVVLIDEVDACIHPSRRLRMLEQVSKAFPFLQFFVTSSCPILAEAVLPGHLYVCEEDRGAKVIRRISSSV